MTRRQISRAAFDQAHKALLLRVRHSRGVERVRALQALKDYVTGSLRSRETEDKGVRHELVR
jgi:hypothetical protein